MGNTNDWIILVIQLGLSGAIGYGAASFKMGNHIEKVDALCLKIGDMEKE